MPNYLKVTSFSRGLDFDSFNFSQRSQVSDVTLISLQFKRLRPHYGTTLRKFRHLCCPNILLLLFSLVHPTKIIPTQLTKILSHVKHRQKSRRPHENNRKVFYPPPWFDYHVHPPYSSWYEHFRLGGQIVRFNHHSSERRESREYNLSEWIVDSEPIQVTHLCPKTKLLFRDSGIRQSPRENAIFNVESFGVRSSGGTDDNISVVCDLDLLLPSND